MRPWRSTSVISATTRPAPELASMPRWVRCQSEATPSLALYWHMGDTTMRLASVRSASRIGEKSALMLGDCPVICLAMTRVYVGADLDGDIGEDFGEDVGADIAGDIVGDLGADGSSIRRALSTGSHSSTS